MNKGIEKRNNTRKNKRRKMVTTKEEQKGICQFIDFSDVVWKKVNGKNKASGRKKGFGLQIENKVYLADGTYKFVNKKSFSTRKVYTEIPENVDPKLLEKYNAYHNK